MSSVNFMQVIACFQCGASNSMPVRLRYQQPGGMDCHYFFCSVLCLSNWIGENESGLPCLWCRSTGWAHGFESNGPCRTCGGSARIGK